jgi:hypothetical protein
MQKSAAQDRGRGALACPVAPARRLARSHNAKRRPSHQIDRLCRCCAGMQATGCRCSRGRTPFFRSRPQAKADKRPDPPAPPRNDSLMDSNRRASTPARGDVGGFWRLQRSIEAVTSGTIAANDEDHWKSEWRKRLSWPHFLHGKCRPGAPGLCWHHNQRRRLPTAGIVPDR